MFKLSFMRTRQLGIHVRFGGRRLRIAMRLFLIPLSIAVLRSDFEKLLDKLPITGELLRGSLLERTVWHRTGCPKCARGEGHRSAVQFCVGSS